MAIMIPSVVSPEIQSSAEKRIFEWFKNDPTTKDWIVLHSLGIANHNKVMHGETDFFVLAPYMGLFALEVKGGRVARKDGTWSFTNRYGVTSSKNRGPFDQAWDGVFSIVSDLKKKIDSKHSYLKGIFFGIGVMFPDIEYSSVGCDEEQWQVFDVNDGKKVGDFIKRLFVHSKEKWEALYGRELPLEKLPNPSDIQYISSILRGDFDKAVAISAQIRDSEDALIELTKEQYRCIDQLEDNKRCLILGGAGTGKTLLAIEEAKRAAAQGERVAVFCFNKNLGEWLEYYFDKTPRKLRPKYCGTFHKYMSASIQNAGGQLQYPRSDEDGDEYYSVVLPKIFKERLPSLEEKFDRIIIDEGQDLITSEYIEVFDACLHEGFTRGKWSIFGDFSRQAIYRKSSSGEKMIEMLEDKTAFIRFKLNINCRNTKTICDEITLVTGFEPPSEIWSKVVGRPVDYLTYSDTDEEKTKLVGLIQSLLDNHISPEKITILSPVRREKSIVDSITEFEIVDYKFDTKDKITFSTIQGFKGLENTIIILSDVESISDTRLMYVGLSRARSALYVIETDNARQEYVAIQLGRLKDGR